jgi:hypothetical protein
VLTRAGVVALLMIVDDFDIFGSLIGPNEADTPLIIDADGMLPAPVTGKRLQSICRWDPQVAEVLGMVKHVELAHGLFFKGLETPDELPKPELFGGAIPKWPNHDQGS